MSIHFNNRILVIDDDESILNIFQSVLTKDPGYNSRGKNLSELKNLLRRPGGKDIPSSKEVRSFQVDVELQGKNGFNRLLHASKKGDPYALIFVDMRMPPGWDGVQTIKAIREIDSCVQIVIVTAYSDATIEEIVNQVGFTDRLLYLKKPFDDQEILQLADSLVTRWNLEKRVQYFDEVLENIISNLGTLDLLDFERTFQPFIKNILTTMGGFLGTDDVLLAKIEDGSLVYKVGVGRFANGISETESFQKIIKKVIAEQRVNTLFQVEDCVVMPISLRNYQNVIIGMLKTEEMKESDNLLMAMAASSFKLFRQGARLTDLCLEVEKLRSREQELLAKIDSLQTEGDS